MDYYFNTNMVYMCSCCIVSDMTFFGDLAVIQSLAYQLCNLSLSRRQMKTFLDIVPLFGAKHNAQIIADSAQKSSII
jgi:hypothetical protein